MANIENKPYDCIVIGAGISGLFAARALCNHGLSVVVLEKSRGVGGRMATRRMDGATLDHGAQFFTVHDKGMKEKFKAMLKESVIASWHENKYGVIRYRGESGMANIGKFLARSLDVRREQRVTQINWKSDHWHVVCDSGKSFRAKMLLSTMPLPQFLLLVRDSGLQVSPEQSENLSGIQYLPAIALLVVLKKPSDMSPPGILQFKEHPALGTITDNELKGLSKMPALTIHSSHSFAQENLELMNEATAHELLQATKEYVRFEVKSWALHRWRYAQCINRHHAHFFRFQQFPLWLAGDGFGNVRLEQAALSGIEAAKSIIKRC